MPLPSVSLVMSFLLQKQAGLKDEYRIADGRRPSPISKSLPHFFHTQYVDNLAAIDSSKQAADEALSTVKAITHALGLPTHDESEA